MSYDKLYTRKGPVAFPSIASTVVLSPNTGSIKDSIHIKSVDVGNSSGANAACGLGIQLPDAMWKAGQLTSNVYVDDTTDAQDSGTNDFAISLVSTNNDGYVVQALAPFNIVNLVIGTAQNGAGTAEYTYWNGSAWTALPTIAVPTVTGTGNVSLVFNEPADWAALASTDAPVATSGLTTGYYAIRVRYTTAPVTTAGLLTSMSVVRLIDYVENVADGTSVTLDMGDFKVPYRANVVPYCSTANANNWVNLSYRQGG